MVFDGDPAVYQSSAILKFKEVVKGRFAGLQGIVKLGVGNDALDLLAQELPPLVSEKGAVVVVDVGDAAEPVDDDDVEQNFQRVVYDLLDVC